MGDADQVAAEQVTENEDFSSLRGAKILLVEDNELNQELALSLLVRQGISVTPVWNGQEALAILQTEGFDGILMDVQMPVMDGYTAAREIRKLPQFKTIPIIAMTANVMAGDREKTEAAGMNDHIGKPFKQHEVLRTMARWITPAEPCEKETSQLVGEKEQKQETADSDEKYISSSFLIGIDMKAGLAICLDDPKMYQKILGLFCESYRNFDQDFLKAQQNDDPLAATRLAHTIKGSAGNIGATDIPQLAQRLETLCREDCSSEEMTSALQELIKELKQLIAGVDRFLADTAKHQSGKKEADEETREKMVTILERFKEELGQKSFRSTATFEEIEEGFGAYVDKEKLTVLADLVQKFEFVQALEVADSLLADE